ncbi:hypothetical protein BXT86_01880 [candidate division WOR-3 bacterium 4484_100]|uniref:LytR/CpsA/Psr regulator C-terminal domain-containing protein n=1 Tax=candidate division WOR-3 bacterium 4484_100 TaxID=1936077 RepID=A0A1V4QHV6_UNCW3|nr:MAG: hypothetical protein BXT86_01880 [candidate division WOR-3 bacterium 4484_100]
MSGKVIFYILIILLTAFLISVIIMFTREDPQEIYRRNSNLRVEVLNGCGVKRLAIKVANILRQRGFNVVQIGNARQTDFAESVVIERSDETGKNARYFAKRTGIKNIGMDVDPALHLDVTLIVGKDYKKIFPDVEEEF